MNVVIDASLMTISGNAVGRIHGVLKLFNAPVGNAIAFLSPNSPILLPEITGFNALLRVELIQLAANNEIDGIQALLKNIVVLNKEEGMKLVKFFTSGFNLYFYEYDQLNL